MLMPGFVSVVRRKIDARCDLLRFLARVDRHDVSIDYGLTTTNSSGDEIAMNLDEK